MNRNGFDNGNGFYSGENNDNGFYSDQNNDVFHNTTDFYQDSQIPDDGFKDPFSAAQDPYPTDLYEDVKNRHVLNYDNFGFSPVGMEAVRAMHPNARLATPIDAKSRLLKLVIAAVIVFVLGLIPVFICVGKEAEQNILLDNMVTAEAEVLDMSIGDKMPEKLVNIKSYYVAYFYTFNDRHYHGSQQLTRDQLYAIGLSNLTSESKGRIVTVMINSRNPEQSILIKDNYIGRGFLMFSPFVLVALVLFIMGGVRYQSCMTGKTAVYENEVGKKKYQKIK